MLESVTKVETVPVERELWGQIEVEEEEEIDEEEEDEADIEDEMEMKNPDDVLGGEVVESRGMETASGMGSTVVPIPESLELRKSRFDIPPTTESYEPRDLYKILPESHTTKGFLGSTGYDFSHTPDQGPTPNVPPSFCPNLISQNKISVVIWLDPSELENLTKEGLKELHDKEMVTEAGSEKEI